ncbi:MAG: chloride channel protein [Promethearchaeota archaeon]
MPTKSEHKNAKGKNQNEDTRQFEDVETKKRDSWYVRLRTSLSRQIKKRRLDISTRRLIRLNVLAVIIGLLAGLGAVGFRYLIEIMIPLFDLLGQIGFFVGVFWVPIGLAIMPIIGGVMVGFLTNKFAPEAEGHGVPEIMTALALNQGKIRPRVPVIKAIASAITIGSGGSAGAEGPIGQIGAGVGSSIGQLLNLSEPELRVLTVCGVSAGIAAVFNAPIGGALFGLEVVLIGIEAIAVIPVLLSTVVGTSIASWFFGIDPWFTVPQYFVPYSWELLLFIVLGLILGLFSIIWVKFLYSTEILFQRIRIPRMLKPALGGVVVGLIIMWFPHVARVGYDWIEYTLLGFLALGPLIILMVMKLFSTSGTIGSGGSGGVFAPSLYMGAMGGGAIGTIFYLLNPGMLTVPMAFAVVGMGALFAGAARAPLTCIIMIAEMTRDYMLLVPLMAACATSYFINLMFSRNSIYTEKLAAKGIRLKHQLIADIIDTITVDQIMRTHDIVVARPHMYAFQVIELADQTHHSTLPVVEGGRLIGLVTVQQAFKSVREDLPPEDTIVAKLARPAPTVYGDDSAHTALDKMIESDESIVCVVDREDPGRFLGILSHGDILQAHNVEWIQQQSLGPEQPQLYPVKSDENSR